MTEGFEDFLRERREHSEQTRRLLIGVLALTCIALAISNVVLALWLTSARGRAVREAPPRVAREAPAPAGETSPPAPSIPSRAENPPPAVTLPKTPESAPDESRGTRPASASGRGPPPRTAARRGTSSPRVRPSTAIRRGRAPRAAPLRCARHDRTRAVRRDTRGAPRAGRSGNGTGHGRVDADDVRTRGRGVTGPGRAPVLRPAVGRRPILASRSCPDRRLALIRARSR